MAKVTFNGTAKEIIINNSVTDIDVTIDLYSDWKEWILTGDNAKYLDAFRTFGGDPISTTQNAPRYYILINGWKVRILSGNVVNISTNLYTDDNSFPLIIEPTASASLKNSDAVVVTTYSGGVTPADVWTYPTRELTAASTSSLTIEEKNQLMKTLTKNKFIGLK